MKRIILAVVLLALVFSVFSLARNKLYGDSVAVVHPVRGSAVQAVYATGTVEPTVMLPITVASAVRIEELNVDEGSVVSKGQVLARLEDEELRQSIKQLQAKEDFAKKEYERNAILVKSNAASKKAFDQAKAEWNAAEAATKEAQAKLDHLQLVAPADGIVIKRDGEVGQLIPASQAVFWLSAYAPLRISGEIDEEDISQVKVGQEVLIRADAFAGKVFHGKVKSITPKGDPVARSYRVRVEFTEDVPLQIGMTAEINIIVSKKDDALLLPSSAVSQNKVWLVEGGVLKQKNVETGAKGALQTEISGISENDMVVLKPTEKIRDGNKVRAKLTEIEK